MLSSRVRGVAFLDVSDCTDFRWSKSKPLIMTPNTVNSQPSSPVDRQWTIHDSNVALHECLSGRKPSIPNEIILQILECSTCWIRTKIIKARLVDDREPIRVGNNLQNNGHQQILATNPLSSLEIARIRRIIFAFRSCDQGWSDDYEHHQTFEASWTWMEASLTSPASIEQIHSHEERENQIRTKEQKESSRFELQRNRHAGRAPENYRCELGIDHDLLQQVEDGDSIVLWARAMYPGWENRVYKAMIEVWCMDDLSGVMDSTA